MNFISQGRAKTVEANKGIINQKNKQINDRFTNGTEVSDEALAVYFLQAALNHHAMGNTT
jgi:hypothetical protein